MERQALDRLDVPGSGGSATAIAGTDVAVVADHPDAGTTTAMWNWVWSDGSEHGVEVTVAGIGEASAFEVVAPLVPDPLADLSSQGIVELPYPLGAGPPGPQALYYRGTEPGSVEISLFDVSLDELAPDLDAVALLTGTTLTREDIEVDGRPGWLVSADGTGAVLAFELPSGRVAVVEGPPELALELAPDVVEVPVDEAIARLEAGRAD